MALSRTSSVVCYYAFIVQSMNNKPMGACYARSRGSLSA